MRASTTDELRLLAYVLAPIVAAIASKGTHAWKAANPGAATGQADVQIRCAHVLKAQLMAWQAAAEPEHLQLARQVHESLGWCLRRLAGQDAGELLRSARPEALYDPNRTFKLASGADMLRRHLGAQVPMRVQ